MSTNKNTMFTVRKLAFCALALALGTVLSFLKLPFKLPYGGSVTLLSMLVITLPGYWFGAAVGITTATAYGLLQLIIEPYVISIPQLIVDYFLAFGALGLSGFFHNRRGGLIKGYLLGIFGRFVFAVLSGVIFFAQYAADYDLFPLVYSTLYNGSYIGLEAVITLVLIALPPVKRALDQVKVTTGQTGRG